MFLKLLPFWLFILQSLTPSKYYHFIIRSPSVAAIAPFGQSCLLRVGLGGVLGGHLWCRWLHCGDLSCMAKARGLAFSPLLCHTELSDVK